jgi:predicted  nucleic acid-binding Zn-ribbon protein
MEFLPHLQPFLQVLQWIVAIIACLFMIYMRSIFVSKKEADAKALTDAAAIASLTTRLANAEGRLDRMHDRMTEAPTAKEINQLHISIERLNGDVRVLNEKMSGSEDLFQRMEHQVSLLDTFLRDRK